MSYSQQESRINDVLYYIHQDICRDLPAAQLAKIAAYSQQHFHRVFKQVVGENVHSYIRRVRLEFAANQLMFDLNCSVLDVATKSGFSSVSSFSRAFKAVFNASPGAWRTSERPSLNRLEPASVAVNSDTEAVIYQAELVQLPERDVAYVRHRGYDRSIKQAWQTLQAWASAQQRDCSQQFGLLHSNPAWVPLAQCRYVACVAIDKPLLARGVVNSLKIPAGLHAVFHLTGRYGDFLRQLDEILSQWLPSSGLKMQSTPAYVKYFKNHFLAEDECYILDFYLPVSFY